VILQYDISAVKVKQFFVEAKHSVLFL